MNIDSIKNGIVIDHISKGLGMEIYKSLKLDELGVSTAIITNAKSKKMNKKDIIKINEEIDINLDIIGLIDQGATINIVKEDKIIKKFNIELPKKVVNLLNCENPRCITTVEKDITQEFDLVNKSEKKYRCKYCEAGLKLK